MICRFERQVIVLLGENVPARVGDWVTPLAQGDHLVCSLVSQVDQRVQIQPLPPVSSENTGNTVI